VPIDLATNKPGKPIHLPGPYVGELVFAPDGNTAYDVPGRGLAGVITPISTATGRTGRPFLIPGGAYDMVFGPGGKDAYVTGLNGAGKISVTPVNLATDNPGRPILRTKDDPLSMVVAPDGKTLYVGTDHGVMPVSTATGKVGKTVGGRPAEEMVITPDGKTVYIANLGGSGAAIVPISTATDTAGKPILKGSYSKIGLSPGGGTLYAASWVPEPGQFVNGQIKIVPINSATGAPGRAIRIPVTVGLPVQMLTP
jgi:DNA-binding beta-propeller fold protein YncE